MKPAKPAPVAAATPLDTAVAPVQKSAAPRRPRAPRTAAPAAAVAPVTATALPDEALSKVKKIKLIRDSYAMPSDEYAQLAQLKEKAATAGVAIKKSELIRAGLLALGHMTERNFLAAVARLPKPVPKKKGKKG